MSRNKRLIPAAVITKKTDNDFSISKHKMRNRMHLIKYSDNDQNDKISRGSTLTNLEYEQRLYEG